MRRALALLLLVGFSFPLIAPLFTSGPDEASLPACCRRNGQHHCAMYATMMVQIPTRYRTVSEKCPYSPFAGAALMLPHGFVAYRAHAIASQAAATAAVVAEAEAGFRISADRTRQKRGPPSLLTL